MKLMTKNGREVDLGPGCVIGFILKDKTMVLEFESDRVCWPNRGGDDKIITPDFIRDKGDCASFVHVMAELLGLIYVRVERPYGPAFELRERGQTRFN